jgi:hypothetical protein
MKRNLRCLLMAEYDLSISAFIIVGIGKILLLLFLMENLELHKIHALLDEVNVPKLLKVKDDFGDGSERH